MVKIRLIEELRSEYGYNTPIFLKEIEKRGMTGAGLRQALIRLLKSGMIERYSQGVYYIPQMTPFGKSKISAKKVYEKKYISNGQDVYGYYVGLVLENAIGLTAQMPNIIEIVTNNEASRVREIQSGSQKLRLRRSKVEITSENAKTLQFLDLMNRNKWESYSENQQQRIIEYAKKQGIVMPDIYKYISYYPSLAAKNILESRLSDELSK